MYTILKRRATKRLRKRVIIYIKLVYNEKKDVSEEKMDKLTKAQRISLITKILVDHPFHMYTLQYFSEKFQCAKSTLSEDINLIEAVLRKNDEGEIISVSGAAGGIYYAAYMKPEQVEKVKQLICQKLNDYRRVIPGGFVYMNDLFFDPKMLKKMAECIITKYKEHRIDYVVTIETKGIPLAMAIANERGIPVAVIRKSARLSEGTTMQMNYVTGSSKSIKTMAMPIRSIQRKSNILLVDDFMKAGGTAKGMADLMSEFEANIVGVAVVLATKDPKQKLIKDYYTLVEYDGVDETKKTVKIIPA